VIARHLKLKINQKDRAKLEKLLWNLTGVYNWTIKTVAARKLAGQPYSEFDIQALTKGHAQKSGVSSRAIHGAIHQAFGAWQRCWSKQNSKPKLKSQRNRLNSILFRSDCRLDIGQGTIKLPGFQPVKFHSFTNGLPEAKPASQVTLIKKPSGWYAVCLFEATHQQAINLDSESIIGIDTGLKSLLTLSNGEKFAPARELETALAQLAKNQRGQSRHKTARTHEKIANQRKDRNHKISHDLVRDHKEIYITNDNLQGQAKLFGRSVQSTAIAQLRNFILYKGSSCGRKVKLTKSQYTTMRCSGCESLTGPTGLSGLNVRHWVCSACSAEHDRDVNAAINILNAGVRSTLEANESSPASASAEVGLEKSGPNYVPPQSYPGRVAI
jgi:putative transposase